MNADTKTVTLGNYQQFTQFKCIHSYKAPVYLLLCGELSSGEVELFNHPDIMRVIVEVYSRDEYDISSYHLSVNSKGIAIGLALCLEAMSAVEGNDREQALRFLEAGECVQSTFTAIGDVQFIQEDGTLPYTEPYVVDNWMEEFKNQHEVENP